MEGHARQRSEINEFCPSASVALSWCFEDEATPAAIALMEQLEIESAFVPQLWSLEVVNILLMAERKGRISYAEITQFLALLQTLPIQVDDQTSPRSFHEILALAHSTKLTSYDTAYLELSMRLGIPLATKDNQLCIIAKQLGVTIIPIDH